MLTKKQRQALMKTVKEINELQYVRETDEAHQSADDALCKLLRVLGCGEVVDAFEKVEKWYE